MPEMHSVQTRFTVADGVVLSPCPAEQVAQAAQVDRPALAVNVDEPHAAHVRSLEIVSSTVSYCPAGHSAVIAAHAAPESTALNDVPELHAAQVLSTVVLPATD